MCGKRDMFSDLDEIVRSDIKFGNDIKISMMGKTISIKLKDGPHKYILDEYYVPGPHQNLLNMGQLSEMHYDIRINKGVYIISDTKKGLIAKVNMTPNYLFF